MKLIPDYPTNIKIALRKLEGLESEENGKIHDELLKTTFSDSFNDKFYEVLEQKCQESELIMSIRKERDRILAVAIPVDYYIQK